MEIVLLIYLSYRNSIRAKNRGLNSLLWGAITACAFLAALMLGLFIVIVAFCGDIISASRLTSTMDHNTRLALSHQVEQAIASNFLHMVTIDLFAVGGYLLIRYILERKPGKKEPEVHWMDRMGEQDS
jgi:hypothetical protein